MIQDTKTFPKCYVGRNGKRNQQKLHIQVCGSLKTQRNQRLSWLSIHREKWCAKMTIASVLFSETAHFCVQICSIVVATALEFEFVAKELLRDFVKRKQF